MQRRSNENCILPFNQSSNGESVEIHTRMIGQMRILRIHFRRKAALPQTVSRSNSLNFLSANILLTICIALQIVHGTALKLPHTASLPQ